MPETAVAARTVALTGATGFFGARILQKLTERSFRVRALTRRPQPPASNVQWISGDLDDQAALHELASGADAIIHCAGLVKARTAAEFDRINNLASRKFCQVVRAATATTKDQRAEKSPRPHFVLISSLAARMPEISAYAASKHAAEEAVPECLADIPWTVIRPPGIYGPGDTEILKLLRAMRLGIALAPGSRNNRFSLLHVSDAAEAVCAALWQPETYAKVVEVDDGKSGGYSMDDVCAHVAAIFGRRIRTITIPESLLRFVGGANEIAARLVGGTPMLTRGKARELAQPDWVSAGSKLESMIGWTPQINLETGLADTIAWYRGKGLL